MSNDPNERLSKLAATFRDLEAYVQQDKVRIIHYGVGAIGAEVVRALLNNPEFEIVGAIDASAAKAGRTWETQQALAIPWAFRSPMIRNRYSGTPMRTLWSTAP